MSGIAEDHDAAIKLILEEYPRLKSHNPNHELLKYICDLTEEGFRYSPDESVRQEFLDKFNPSNSEYITTVLCNYHTALRDANDKIEGIDRSPNQQPKSSPENLESQVEKEIKIPF